MLLELQEESQQFKHVSAFCLCAKTVTVGWAVLTCLILDRVLCKQDEPCLLSLGSPNSIR